MARHNTVEVNFFQTLFYRAMSVRLYLMTLNDEQLNKYQLCVDDRLMKTSRLDSFSLSNRRTRVNLIKGFRILHIFEKLTLESIFEMNRSTLTRGNAMNLKGQRCINTLARRRCFQYSSRQPLKQLSQVIIR